MFSAADVGPLGQLEGSSLNSLGLLTSDLACARGPFPVHVIVFLPTKRRSSSDLVLCSLIWLVAVVQSLRRVGKDTTVLLICVTVFLSYLPEAGQYSSFFLYLRQVTYPSQEALVSGDRSSLECRMCVAGH